MQENKKSGPVCCGQNPRNARFYQRVSLFSLCLGLSGGLFWLLSGENVNAAICFLPDCGDEVEEFKGDANISSQYCRDEGYTYYELGQCPEYNYQEVCVHNSHYLKCDANKWCIDNGYKTKAENCNLPKYPDQQCPNGLNLYKQCKTDYEKACMSEDEDYVSQCKDGWQLDADELCSYSSSYGKCCNKCSGYDYTATNIPTGYVKGDSCEACGGITKYKKEINECLGYKKCAEGGKTGTATCMHGSEKWYKECCSSCDGYHYDESSIPVGYLKGESCESCSGTKYKTKVGECASGYLLVGNSCRQPCSVGDILNSDMSCSSSKISGKTPIGVVSYINGSKRLAINLKSTQDYWNLQTNDATQIPDYSSSPHQIDFNGRENTAAYIRQYGNRYAPGYCNNYTTPGTKAGDWYLPAQGELYQSVWVNKSIVNRGLSAAGGTTIQNEFHWSSSECTRHYDVWIVNAYSGTMAYRQTNKNRGDGYVRCVMEF